jgi:hypothetical protein
MYKFTVSSIKWKYACSFVVYVLSWCEGLSSRECYSCGYEQVNEGEKKPLPDEEGNAVIVYHLPLHIVTRHEVI